ncbi:MAG TPA: LacI family transcriptional regulator [Lachnospiraceae bacterium]|nr:LacI family transcriptional regulator [Lachnospiraceae bacterium]
MVSIKDVAKQAGVSISTVSNVLNGTKYVSENLVIKVNQAVKDLNYEVDPIARNLKTRQTKTIGVITIDMCGLFYPYVVKGMYEELNQKGYNLMICDLSGSKDSKSSMEREMDSFKNLVSNRVDGIIFASTVSGQREEGFARDILKMANRNKKIPLVSLEKDFSRYGIDSVFSDGIEGGKQAIRHLIDCGCKNVGHITGPIFSGEALERLEGYRLVLMECGMAVDMEQMVANGNYTHQSGYIAMNELLKKYPSIDGVFVANDQMAVGALKALAESGKRVPEDVKVIGYDNVFISGILQPPLSSIHVRKQSFGSEAARILLQRIEKPAGQDALALKMDTKLVVRKSTVADAVEDWILSDW